jgi:hypothetical protein
MSINVTYLIPCRKITKQVVSRLTLLTDHLASSERIEFLILTGEKPDCQLVDRRVRVLFDESAHSNLWAKIAATKFYDLKGDHVVLMADDDLNFVTLADLESWEDDINCGHSRHLMIMPRALGSYTLFDGWTHFFASESYPSRSGQVAALIGEGPCTVYSTYRSGYFRSIALLIGRLDAVLSSVQGANNIIEDCINLSNLVCGVKPLPDSILLRLLNSPPLRERGIKMSRVVFQEIEKLPLLDQICSILSEHLALHINPSDSHFYDREGVCYLLKRHVDGYAAANSRKWRGWIDVEFRPFEKPGYGLIVPTADRKFNPVYYWGGRQPLDSEIFPMDSFLSRPIARDLIRQLPDSYWVSNNVAL